MSITNQLMLFLDVVQQGSFTKAAALHDMDNSSLSKQIKKLESSLGVQLLSRSTRSFSLTPVGSEIIEQANVLMDTLDQIQNIADSYQSEPKGTLRISSAVFFGQVYLQPVITQFMQTYPNVKVSLMLDDRRTDIIADHFDVSFRLGQLENSSLIAKPIAKTHFALVASNSFIEAHGMPETPEQLSALPAVIYSNGARNLDSFQMSEEPHGKRLKSYKMEGYYKVSDVRALISAVQSGIGYALIDLSNLEFPIDELGFTPLLTEYALSNANTGIYAIYPHRKQTFLVQAFIQAVQEYVGSPAFWVDYMPDYKTYYR